jgi:predicted transposase YdaD
LEALSSSVEEWIYTFKYLHKLYECPKEIKDKELKELYIEAQINKLTKKEMNRYKRSVLEYDDVRDAVSFAEEKGIKIGEQRGLKIGEQRGIKIGRLEGRQKGRLEGRLEGREEGRQEGRLEGKKEARVQVIRDCYSRGISVKQIAEFMGFTEEEILSMLEN